jgi:polyferredoxin
VLRRVLRPRVLVYTAVLVLIVAALLTSLMLRSPFKVDVVRDRGTLARIVDDGWVENVYRLQIMNTTERVQSYRIAGGGLERIVIEGPGDVQVEGAQARWVAVSLRVPPETAAQAGAGSHAITFSIERVPETPADKPLVLVEKSTFVVPR